MKYSTSQFILQIGLLFILCLQFAGVSQINDSLADVENVERLYKRDIINQIKKELLESTKKEEKKEPDKEQLEKIEIVATHAYSSLSHQLIQLKQKITEAFQKKKDKSTAATKQVHITFTLFQSDTIITAAIDKIDPTDKILSKKIKKVFDEFSFSPLPVKSPEIQLQLSVSLSE